MTGHLIYVAAGALLEAKRSYLKNYLTPLDKDALPQMLTRATMLHSFCRAV